MHKNVNSNKYGDFDYHNQNFSNLTLMTNKNKFLTINYNLKTTTKHTTTMRTTLKTHLLQFYNIKKPMQSKYNSLCEIPENFNTNCSVKSQNRCKFFCYNYNLFNLF